MRCPYCGEEMEKGLIHGGARGRIYWKKGTERATIGEILGGVGLLKATKIGLAYFTLEAHFCRKCKKMIIDTDVTR